MNSLTRVLDKWQRGGEIQILKDKFILLKMEFDQFHSKLVPACVNPLTDT